MSTRARQFGSIFFITVAISLLFVLAGVLFTKPFDEGLSTSVGWIIDSLGWFYLLVTTFFLAFVAFFAFSKYGRIKLGGPDEEPEFGRFAWFAMLFQAGMGIGLLFWGVAQPLLHYREPPLGLAEPGTSEAAALGLQFSLFHWTLHPWAIYGVVDLAVAYFSFVRGTRSLRISSVAWGAIMAVLAAILLVAGGLDALQNGAILAATPFALIMVLMCWSLHKAVADDVRSGLVPLEEPRRGRSARHGRQPHQVS